MKNALVDKIYMYPWIQCNHKIGWACILFNISAITLKQLQYWPLLKVTIKLIE